MKSPVSLTRQIAAVKGESLNMARRMRTAVGRREMNQGEADYLIESLEAAITTLEWLAAHEDVVRRVHEEARARLSSASSPEEVRRVHDEARTTTAVTEEAP